MCAQEDDPVMRSNFLDEEEEEKTEKEEQEEQEEKEESLPETGFADESGESSPFTPEKAPEHEPPKLSAGITPLSVAAKTEEHVTPAAHAAGAKVPAANNARKVLSNEQVTGHTASLWKYHPIPENEPEPAPEYLNCMVKFPASTIIGARVRGKKHKHEGTNCDDWYEVGNIGDITFIAVSDGAGSKRFSRIGARESCKAAVGFMIKAFNDTLREKPEIMENIRLSLTDPACIESCSAMAALVQRAVVKAYEAVEAAFYSRSVDPAYSKVIGRELQFKDFSGTLLLLAVIPINKETKENLFISCQIGDGMIAVINSAGSFESSLRLLGIPDSGDYSGETDFLTSPQMRAMETLQKRTKVYRGMMDTVMVMTDGVADDYFPNDTEMRRLYFDLLVNRIIGDEGTDDDLPAVSKADLSLFKRIPDPLAYPWVNDQNTYISLQYTKRICEGTGMTLKDMWENKKVLQLAKLELNQFTPIKDNSERLKIWLDNYVERGSFDDRTLVIAQL